MPSPVVRRRLDRSLLERMLDHPDLLPQVRALLPEALQRAIVQVGLEDAGELIALASQEQLRDVFDEDLWRSARPGQDDTFDATRFALWLEVLLEAGDAFVADRLANLSEDFLFFAFSELICVIDTTAPTASIEDATEAHLLEKLLDARPGNELDEYQIVSRIEVGWDAVWASLLALDQRHGPLLRAILERCAQVMEEQAEEAGGLYATLTDSERLLEDARAEREDRRAERGYISPADARAFLSLARTAPTEPDQDPITRSYFRHLAPTVATPIRSDAAGPTTRSSSPPLLQIVAEAGLEPPPDDRGLQTRSVLHRSISELLESDPEAHRRIVDELTYLANALVAGDVTRRWHPAEAADRVLAVCDLGLRALLERSTPADAPESPSDTLRRWGPVGLFRVAWGSDPPSSYSK